MSQIAEFVLPESFEHPQRTTSKDRTNEDKCFMLLTGVADIVYDAPGKWRLCLVFSRGLICNDVDTT